MVHRTFFRRKKETCPFVPSPSSTSGPIIKMYLRQHIIPGEPTAKWTWQFKEFALKEISLQHARLSSARVSLGGPRRRNKYWRVLLPRYRKKLSCPFSASSSSFVAESSGFFLQSQHSFSPVTGTSSLQCRNFPQWDEWPRMKTRNHHCYEGRVQIIWKVIDSRTSSRSGFVKGISRWHFYPCVSEKKWAY